MLTKGIALHGMAVLVGGLIATSAMAQTQLASAVPAPQRDVLVFTEKGGQLSPTARIDRAHHRCRSEGVAASRWSAGPRASRR